MKEKIEQFKLGNAIELAWSTIIDWLETAATLLPNFVVAVVVLVFFFIFGRLVKRPIGRLTGRFVKSKALTGLVSQLAFLAFLGVGLIIALNVLHLDKTVTSLLAGAGIVGLALGFAFQDISANFIAGILMAIRRPISVGDIIETNGHMGTVHNIDLRTTTLETFQGLHVIIPNRQVFQEPLTNYTKTKKRRIDLEVGVSYGDDLEKALETTRKALERNDKRLKEEPIAVNLTEFGDSSIGILATFWIHYPGEPGFLEARSAAILTIKQEFDKADITIPFPIRTLDFGIKGGQPLKEQVALNGTGSA